MCLCEGVTVDVVECDRVRVRRCDVRCEGYMYITPLTSSPATSCDGGSIFITRTCILLTTAYLHPQDFDLCLSCYDSTKHEHPMEKLGLGMIDPEDQETAAEQDPQVTL